MNKKTKETIIIILFMSPFLLISIIEYAMPLIFDITMRTSILMYIHASINQLIALVMGFMFVVSSKKR